MKKMRALKILTGFTVGLAVCVAALFVVTIISPGKSEIRSADTEITQEQTAGVIVEEVNRAAANVNIPEKGEKNVDLCAIEAELESEEEYYEDEYVEEEYYEEEYVEEYYEDEYVEEPTDEYAEYEEVIDLTPSEEEYYEEPTEGYYEEQTEYYEEQTEEYYEEQTEEYYEETTEEYYEETTEEYYEEQETTESDYEEPTTNVPDPVIDTELTEGNLIAAQIAKYAESFVGVLPYNWAHHSLDPNEGADCSGFTHALYEAFGYDWLSYNDYGQSQQGRSVLYEEWLPGDIMCYWGHVGIYVGDGIMVHCPEPGRYVEYCSATYTEPFDVRRMVE